MGDWADWWRKQCHTEKDKWLYEGNRIELNGKTAYWRDVIKLFCYALNANDVTRLTEEHIFSSSSDKMKVSYASQVFSKRISNELRSLAEKFPIKYPTALETTDVLETFDDLFDHMNGSNLKKRDNKIDSSRRYVSLISGHLKKWIELHNIFKSLKFKYGKNKILKKGSDCTIQTPTSQAIVDNLTALIGLSNFLLNEGGLKDFNLRNTTQDQLENFFWFNKT